MKSLRGSNYINCPEWLLTISPCLASWQALHMHNPVRWVSHKWRNCSWGRSKLPKAHSRLITDRAGSELGFPFSFTRSLVECLLCAISVSFGGGGGVVTMSCPTLATPWSVAHQAPLSVGFPRQGYWSGWPFPSSRDRPNPGIKPESPILQAGSLPLSQQGSLLVLCIQENERKFLFLWS